MTSDDENENNRSPRFNFWFALAVFSAVCLGATVSQLEGDKNADEKWVISVTSISMSLAFLAVVAHFVAVDKFVGQKAEGAISFLVLLFWAAGLPIIMDPNNRLAQRSNSDVNLTVVTNSNLYFFSWGAFACILFICGNYAQNLGAHDFSSTPPKMTKWYMLTATSVVVMASSIKINDSLNCTDDANNDSETCMRNKYAISLGVCGTFLGLAFLALASWKRLSLMMEAGLAVILFGMYCFGVGFITFGEGPGITIGNLYFSTWIGFSVGLFLTSQCFSEVMRSRKEGSSDTNPPTTQPEIKVSDHGKDTETPVPADEETPVPVAEE